MESPLHSFPEAVIILDNDNQIIGVNIAGEQLLKIKQTDLIGKSIDDVFPPQSSSAYRDEILAGGRKEVSLYRSDGQIFYAELTVSSINGINGNTLGRVVIVRDNKYSQQSEMRLRQEESLKSQNAILRALQETTLDLHSSLELDVVLRNIVERACELLGTTHGYLDIMRETGELEPVVGIGASEEYLKRKVKKGAGVAGTVWGTGKPLVISDYDKWQGRIDSLKYGAIRAIVGMPMILKGQVVGVIGVAWNAESNAPTT